uniref:Uncharacterized protein n=1 Tax=Cucumis melo TaxID=3656 RepID=A0A9I9ED35_CUCME
MASKIGLKEGDSELEERVTQDLPLSLHGHRCMRGDDLFMGFCRWLGSILLSWSCHGVVQIRYKEENRISITADYLLKGIRREKFEGEEKNPTLCKEPYALSSSIDKILSGRGLNPSLEQGAPPSHWPEKDSEVRAAQHRWPNKPPISRGREVFWNEDEGVNYKVVELEWAMLGEISTVGQRISPTMINTGLEVTTGTRPSMGYLL